MKPRWDILLNPLYLGMLFLLFLNDFVLKLTFPGFVTGKLSDFAGVFVFTLFWMALLPRFKVHLAFLSALWFIYWKSPLSEPFIQVINGLYRISRVVDYSDLSALIVIPIAILFFKKIEQSPLDHAYFIKRMGVIMGSLFLFCSTSRMDPYRFGDIQYHEASFSSKKNWKTNIPIEELKTNLTRVTKQVESDSNLIRLKFNEMKIGQRPISLEVSFTLEPIRKKTKITIKQFQVRYPGDKNIRLRHLNRIVYDKLEFQE